ncbi:MAG: hypothetical protein ACR2KZ_13920 [Segetibacter sp.]
MRTVSPQPPRSGYKLYKPPAYTTYKKIKKSKTADGGNNDYRP